MIYHNKLLNYQKERSAELLYVFQVGLTIVRFWSPNITKENQHLTRAT